MGIYWFMELGLEGWSVAAGTAVSRGSRQCQPSSVPLSIAQLISLYALALFSGRVSSWACILTDDNLKLIPQHFKMEKEEGAPFSLSASILPILWSRLRAQTPAKRWCTKHSQGLKSAPERRCLLTLIDRLTQTLCNLRIPEKEGTLANTRIPVTQNGEQLLPYAELFLEQKWRKQK